MKYLEPENMSGQVFDEIFISDILCTYIALIELRNYCWHEIANYD